MRSINNSNGVACHDPHASASKGLLRENKHDPFAGGDCDKCHEQLESTGSFEVSKPKQELCLECHKSVEAFKELTNHHNLDDQLSCLNCHNPHASNTGSLLIRNQVDLCMECHFNDTETNSSMIPHPGTECIDCHQPHGANDKQLLITRSSELCSGCHESSHKVSHPSGPEVIDPRTEEPVTCLSCHQLHGARFENYLPLSPEMDLCLQCHRK